jgi:hypothetical protein
MTHISRLEKVERRLQILEDTECIKKLKSKYCHYCDESYNADGIASLFVENGIWDGGKLFGRYESRKEIKKFFQRVSKEITFAFHAVVGPTIEIKGNNAHGTWYLLQSSTLKKGNQAVWGAGRYDEDYVKTRGEWKFKKIKVSFFYWTPYEFGWARKRIVDE